MSTQAIAILSSRDVRAHQKASRVENSAQPFLMRLDDVPATVNNRLRIRRRVEKLNRALEESGTPFRLRLL